MIKISVIIPAYNAENTILNCIKSVYDSEGEFECIVINDGSIDNTNEVVQTLIGKYRNLIYINKKNEGVSSARNIGIKMAKGEWIFFLDSDDLLVERWYEKISISLKNNKYDFIIFRYVNVVVNEKPFVNNYTVYCDEENRVKKLLLLTPELNTCWGKLFKKEYIDLYNLKFNRNVTYGEDFLFVADYITHSLVAKFDDTVILKYINNVNSIMNSNLFIKRLDDNLVILKKRVELASKFDLLYLLDGIYKHHFKVLTAMMIDISKAKIDIFQKYIIYKQVKKHAYTNFLFNIGLKQLNGIKRCEYLLMSKAYFISILYFVIKGIFRKEHSIT